MTSVAPLPFEDVLGNLSRGFGFAHVNALVLCCEPDITPQLLATKTSNLQKEIEDRAGNLLDERDRMIQQRLWLQNELDNVGAG